MGNSPSSKTIKEAVHILKQGGIAALPTEGVYGLSCLPTHLDALKRICRIKQRDESKGFILVGSDIDQLESYIEALSPEQYERITTWPTPITWLAPVKTGVEPLIHGNKPTVAIRITKHPELSAICQALGQAIVSTSANRSDEPPAISANEVKKIFAEGEIDYILDAPLGGLGRPTEIRDLQSQSIMR